MTPFCHRNDVVYARRHRVWKRQSLIHRIPADSTDVLCCEDLLLVQIILFSVCPGLIRPGCFSLGHGLFMPSTVLPLGAHEERPAEVAIEKRDPRLPIDKHEKGQPSRLPSFSSTILYTYIISVLRKVKNF